MAKEEKTADVLIFALVLDDDLKKIFIVEDVYPKENQRIISDKNESFTNSEQWKEKTISVVKERGGGKITKEVNFFGALKKRIGDFFLVIMSFRRCFKMKPVMMFLSMSLLQS